MLRDQQGAKVRAEALLLEHLDEDQRASYEANGTFVVEMEDEPPYYYKILPAVRRITCPEKNRWYCLQSVRDVPDADWGLAVKLFLEADEAGFLGRANSFVLDRNRLDPEWIPLWQFNERPNYRCDIEFTGPIHFGTLAQARAYAERRNWHVEINIDRHDVPPIYEDVSWFDQEPTYEVDGRPSDEMTVQLLWEACQQREGARPDAEPTDAQRVLAELPCSFHVGVREGHCS